MAKGKKAKGGKSKGKSKKPTDLAPSVDEVAQKALQRKKYLLEHTHKIGEDIKFKPYEIEDDASGILKNRLGDKTYDPKLAEEECQLISKQISEVISKKRYKHYKHVVLVSIGSVKERPGIYLGSKCLWNDKTDSSTTVRFQNTSLFAMVLIYGLYYE